jgi:uncharacterized protein YbjT (DUF2867 family)
VLQGDLASTPDAAFDGIDAAFVFPAYGAGTFVEQAVAAGVRRFVVLSSLAVSGRNARDAASASARHHREVEDAVTSRTPGWTILRPGNFANNLLSWSFPIRSGAPVRVPYPTSSQVLIHERDIAAAAVMSLTEPGRRGHVLELSGPQSLTRIEQLAAISTAVGHEVPFVEVGPEEFRQDVARFIPNDVIDMLLQYWSETVDAPERPLPPVPGVEQTPLARWATDHRSAFAA